MLTWCLCCLYIVFNWLLTWCLYHLHVVLYNKWGTWIVVDIFWNVLDVSLSTHLEYRWTEKCVKFRMNLFLRRSCSHRSNYLVGKVFLLVLNLNFSDHLWLWLWISTFYWNFTNLWCNWLAVVCNLLWNSGSPLFISRLDRND